MEEISLKERTLVPIFSGETLDEFFEENIETQVSKEHPNLYKGIEDGLESDKLSSNYLLFLRITFLITGIFSTLIAQTMFYNGVADESSLITVMASYLGMALIGVFSLGPTLDSKYDITPHRKMIILLSLIDVFGNGLVTAGMFRIGSGLYQVVCALLIPFIALLSKIILNRNLKFLQWWGILAIFIGLTFNTFINQITFLEGEINYSVSGLLLTSSGIFLYAGCYVFTEKLLTETNAPPPKLVCQWTGIYGTIICLVFHLLYTIPNRFDKISFLLSSIYTQTNPTIEQEQASILLSQGIGGFILLTLSALAHNSSYYTLVGSAGAVSTGIMQALRTVGVLVLSAFLYCGNDSHQCLSPTKFASAFIVVLGVFIFSISS